MLKFICAQHQILGCGQPMQQSRLALQMYDLRSNESPVYSSSSPSVTLRFSKFDCNRMFGSGCFHVVPW